MSNFQPRKIENLTDIVDVLDSPRASSVELLECAKLAGRLKASDLRRQAAIRLLESLKTQSKHSGLDVLDAAKHVVASAVQSAQQLEQLSDYLRNVKQWLEGIRKDSTLKTNQTEDLIELVSETLLLVSSTDDQSTVELSSRLRKLENAELAAAVVAPLVSRDPSNKYATNTYCAALVDVGRASEAVPLLRAVLRNDSQDTYNLLVLSRAYSWLGSHREAHHYALNAFRLNPGEYSAHRLLSSASEVDDETSFEDALRVVEEALDAQQRAISPNILLLAAEELVEANNVASASVAIKKLLELKWKGPNVKRVSALKWWLYDQVQPRLDVMEE